MKRAATAAIPFLRIGAVFPALGSTGRSAFLAVDVAFLVLGVVLSARGRRPE